VMISHGVQISIARGVGEKVRGSNYRTSFFFLFLFLFLFFFIYIMYSLLRYKNSHAALAMA